MERKAHYDSILDRSKRITWQDDCYVDLQSTSCSLSSQAEAEGKSFFFPKFDGVIDVRSKLFLTLSLINISNETVTVFTTSTCQFPGENPNAVCHTYSIIAGNYSLLLFQVCKLSV